MVTIYSGPEQYSIVRAGLEVYRTDEENFKPYVSTGVVTETKTKTKTDEESEEEETTEEDENKPGFTLHQ